MKERLFSRSVIRIRLSPDRHDKAKPLRNGKQPLYDTILHRCEAGKSIEKKHGSPEQRALLDVICKNLKQFLLRETLSLDELTKSLIQDGEI